MRRGYTLIEVLIAVAIIAILVAMVGFSVRGFRDGIKERQTRQFLHALVAIEREIRIAREQPIHRTMRGDSTRLRNAGLFVNHDGVYPYDWSMLKRLNAVDGDDAIVSGSIERFAWAAYDLPNSVAWEMIARMPTRVARDGGDGFMAILDGWGRPYRYRSHTAEYNWPHFISAGRDGQLGTDDDIYSYDLEG